MMLRFSLAAAFLVIPLGAHHSASTEFDTSKPLTLRGIVRHVQWTNPHAWIRMDIKQPGESAAEWQVQVSAPGFLRRQGLNESTLTVGTEVTVDVFPARDGSRMADARAGGTLALGNGLNVVTPPFMPAGADLLEQVRSRRVAAARK